MQDIAKRVGVTGATVSNVLNEKYIPERPSAIRLAARIRKVAEEMGYRPSASARATRTGQTGFIGMIHSPVIGLSVQDPLFNEGLDEALHQRGMCLVRDMIDPDADTAPQIVREKTVDGLIINYAFDAPAPVHDLLERCRIPAIWINCKRDRNCVRPDDVGAAFEATQYLIRHGHTDIAYLRLCGNRHTAAFYPHHYSRQDRVGGYMRAMRKAGLPPRVNSLQMPEDFVASKFGWQLKAAVEYLRRPDRPSAILCNLDGRTVLHAAALAGLRIPQDLSVMAFDDNKDANERVAIDHVLVPYWPMSMAVMSELCELIKHPGKPREPVVVPFCFYGGNTVAPPESR